MKNGKCPKCGSNNIVILPGNKAKFQSQRKAIALGWLRSVWTDDYICENCLYVESYVNERDKDKVTKLA